MNKITAKAIAVNASVKPCAATMFIPNLQISGVIIFTRKITTIIILTNNNNKKKEKEIIIKKELILFLSSQPPKSNHALPSC